MKNEIIYFPALMQAEGLLRCIPCQFHQMDTQTILRDLADIKDMCIKEYAENGCYVSNICEIEEEYQKEVLRRL